MSVISFRAREPGASAPARIERWALAAGGGPGPYHLIDILLAVFVVTMLVTMELWKGQEVAPYQALFLALTLVYGFRVWPLMPTLVVTFAVTIATGWIMVRHHLTGTSTDAELVEIPLMPLLFLVMVWHARRRVAALRELELMADQRRAVIDREREFFRDASHAIRTPVTIARGHLELLETAVTDPLAHEDLSIALRQLDRMSALVQPAARAGAARRRQRPPAAYRWTWPVLVDEVGRNWASSADRSWESDCPPTGLVQADPEWLELALDALIENAVHFTGPRDQIVLSCRVDGDWFIIAVADSGPGISADDLPHVFERFWHRRPPTARWAAASGCRWRRPRPRPTAGTSRPAARPRVGRSSS